MQLLLKSIKKKKMCSCFLELCPLNKYFEGKNLNKNDGNIVTSETHCFFYVFLAELLWWKYGRIPVAVKNIDHLFIMASEIIKADRLHLFLLSDGTRIDDNEYLSSLENSTELIVCTEEQIQKLLIYFELKRYLSLKNISHPLNIDYFLWYSK